MPFSLHFSKAEITYGVVPLAAIPITTSFSLAFEAIQCANMPPIRTENSKKLVEQEGRLELAISAYKNKQIPSISEAARLFNVPQSEEFTRVILHGALHLCGYRDKSRSDQRLMRKKENFYLEGYRAFHVKQRR